MLRFKGFISIFGVIFALLVPPFQSPDEPNHFLRAWQVSEGHFFPEKTENRLGGMLPESLSQVCDSFSFLKNNPSARLKFSTLRHALNIPLQPEKRRFTDFANTAIYAPTAYIPQAAAIAILRPFGATPLQLLYAARMANLLAWLALVAAALRLLPFLQTTLSAIALLPATLCIAASANADVWNNGLCWWLIAALLSDPVTGHFWKKLAAGIIVAANKLIALPLVLLGFFSNMHRRQVLIIAAAAMLAAIAWSQLAQAWFLPYEAYNPAFRDTQTLNSGVDPARQLAFIAENPIFFVKTALQSLFRVLPSMAAHFVGKFGWEKNYLPSGWIGALWVMLAALVLSEKNPLTQRQRWGMAGVAALYFIGFAVTMYALWNAVGAAQIDNWQGRYFLAIAPVVVLAVATNVFEKWKPELERGATLLLFMSNAAMVFSVWERYW